MKKARIFALIVLSFWGYTLFAQNNTTTILEGTWIVFNMKQGNTTADESALNRNNLEYNIVIENNIGVMVRMVNGIATSAVRFEIINNIMRDESGGELPYSLNNGILTITFPRQDLVLSCRKKPL